MEVTGYGGTVVRDGLEDEDGIEGRADVAAGVNGLGAGGGSGVDARDSLSSGDMISSLTDVVCGVSMRGGFRVISTPLNQTCFPFVVRSAWYVDHAF
jgi:hypothetical protein